MRFCSTQLGPPKHRSRCGRERDGAAGYREVTRHKEVSRSRESVQCSQVRGDFNPILRNNVTAHLLAIEHSIIVRQNQEGLNCTLRLELGCPSLKMTAGSCVRCRVRLCVLSSRAGLLLLSSFRHGQRQHRRASWTRRRRQRLVRKVRWR